MDLLRLLKETIFEWVRQVFVDVSGRYAEEFVGKRLKRGPKAKRRRKRRGRL
jgi:hypothetical protein